MDISLDWLNQHKPGNTAKFFNLEFIEQVADTYKIKVTFPPESTNPMNMVQGGMITAAMDDATAMVIISAYEFKKSPLSTDLHVLFHRPVAVGEAVIEVRLIKLGQKLATVEGKLFNADNKLAATLLHTIQPTDMPDGKRPSI
tara:strand:- start:123 stop:551 length:429 start_codon:yes stop_codon:yes gene_type:complete